MKNTHLTCAWVLASAMWFQAAWAQTNVIPSCYGGEIAAPTTGLDVELFVLVDQTTLLDDQLKKAVAEQVRPFLTGGRAFSIVVFSAYTQGKYTQGLSSGQLDWPLPAAARDNIKKPTLKNFDQCLTQQPALAAKAAGNALREAFSGSSGEIAKSDVLASLKDIAGKVRQSKAKEQVVLLVSDMLENSSISSFYAKQSVRLIDPDKEMKLVTSNDLLADFGGARVYVLGAGLLGDLAPKSKAAYRDPKTMQALSHFWTAYFDKSKAKLMEFGQPALLNPIK